MSARFGPLESTQTDPDVLQSLQRLQSGLLRRGVASANTLTAFTIALA